MAKEDVINVPSDPFLSPCSSLSGGGAGTCLRDASQLLCQLASGFGQCEDSERLGLQGEGGAQDSSLL